MKFGERIDSLKGSTLGNVLLHSRNYLNGDFATKALGFISLPVFTRLLDTDDYGVVSIFITTLGLAATIFTLNLTDGIGRYYYELDKKDFGKYLSSITQLVGSLLLVAIVLISVFRESFMSWINLPNEIFYLLLLGLVYNVVFKIFRSIHVAQKLSKEYVYANISVGYSAFGLSVLLLLVFSGTKIFLRIAGILIAQYVVSAWMILKSCTYIVWNKIQWDHVKYNLKFGLPRLPYVLSGTILSQFDRIMLGKLEGMSEAGIYAVAYNIGGLSMLIIGAITPALIPNFYKLMNTENYEEVDELNVKILWIICVFAMILTVMGYPLLKLLADEKYHGGGVLIPFIILGYVFFAMAQVYNRFAGYFKMTILQSIAALSAGILNIYLNYLYIPKYGMIASAYTTAVCYAILALLSFVLVKVFIKGHQTPILKILMPVLTFCIFICLFVYFVG